MPSALVVAGSPLPGWEEAAVEAVEALQDSGYKVYLVAEPPYSPSLGRRLGGRGVLFLRPSPRDPGEAALRLLSSIAPRLVVYVARPGPSTDGMVYAAGCLPAPADTYPAHLIEAAASSMRIPSLGLFRGPPEMGSYRDPASLNSYTRCPPSPRASTTYAYRIEGPGIGRFVGGVAECYA